VKEEPQIATYISRFPVKTVKSWFENCSKSHRTCVRQFPGRLPRRVIDVGHTEAFLYETKGEIAPYITLSHCWAYSKPLKTTKANLSEHKGHLAWNRLPLAFQECILIARALGIRYAWIDSLCIVQDDEEEWELESAGMARIYEYSTITLAFHQSAPNVSSFPNPMLAFRDGSQQASPFEIELYPDQGSVLEDRGWCFQVSYATPISQR
jgi:hypothetical protein